MKNETCFAEGGVGNFFPRYLPWMVFSKGRDIAEFFIVIKNRPGELSKVLNIFSKHGVNLIDVSAYSPVEEENVPVFIFADVTGKESIINKLEYSLEDETGYKVVIKRGFVKGFMIDELGFPICSIPGMQAIILSGPDFEGMIKGLYEKFGDIFSVYLYHLAYYGGKAMAKILVRELGLTGESLLREAIKIYMAYGLGRMELVKYTEDSSKIEIRLHNSIECSVFKGRGRVSSNFIRGHLDGLINGLFSKNIKLVEVKCIAKGDKYCEFSSI
jgi:predicted hydrocarbon binding protein